MATVTLTFSAEHATRIQAALEESLRLTDENGDPRAADLDDLKTYMVGDLRQFVRTSEKRVARVAAEATVSDVELT